MYTDRLAEYLQLHGHSLTKLNLVHVEELDQTAFAIVTICCPNLIELGLRNCELVEEGRATQGNSISTTNQKHKYNCIYYYFLYLILNLFIICFALLLLQFILSYRNYK